MADPDGGYSGAVASNRIVVDAPPAVVFRTLVDPSSYAYWVVGAKTIRGVDEAWPAPGSKFHHSVGLGPVLVEDSTSVLRRLRRLAEQRLDDIEVPQRTAGTGRTGRTGTIEREHAG